MVKTFSIKYIKSKTYGAKLAIQSIDIAPYLNLIHEIYRHDIESETSTIKN